MTWMCVLLSVISVGDTYLLYWHHVTGWQGSENHWWLGALITSHGKYTDKWELLCKHFDVHICKGADCASSFWGHTIHVPLPGGWHWRMETQLPMSTPFPSTYLMIQVILDHIRTYKGHTITWYFQQRLLERISYTISLLDPSPITIHHIQPRHDKATP